MPQLPPEWVAHNQWLYATRSDESLDSLIECQIANSPNGLGQGPNTVIARSSEFEI